MSRQSWAGKSLYDLGETLHLFLPDLPTSKKEDRPLLLPISEMNYEQVRAEKGRQKCRQRPFQVQRGALIPGVIDSPWKTLQEVLSITPKDITTAAAVFTKTRGGVDAAQSPRDSQPAKAPPGRRARMESEIPSGHLLTAFI